MRFALHRVRGYGSLLAMNVQEECCVLTGHGLPWSPPDSGTNWKQIINLSRVQKNAIQNEKHFIKLASGRKVPEVKGSIQRNY